MFAVFKGLQEESLQKKENSVLTCKHMIKCPAASVAAEWRTMWKDGFISMTLKFSSNRWKDFCVPFESPCESLWGLYNSVALRFPHKNEHWVTEQPENCVHLIECGGQTFRKSRSSGRFSGRVSSKSLHGWRTHNGIFDEILCCLVSWKHTSMESGIGKIDAEWITKGAFRFISQATLFGIKCQNTTLLLTMMVEGKI